MGRRSRQRERLVAPVSEYRDDDGNVLSLRASLTPGSRRQYRELSGAGLDREDAWQRAVEFLFERLAVVWSIAGLELEGQKQLLSRYRLASEEERRFVRQALREHVSEHFPEMEAP